MTLDEQLIEAVKYRNIEEVRSLLARGASANAVDNWTHKPTVLLWAAEEGKKEVVELLLEHGANINNSSKEEKPTWTPLHGAIEKKHEEVAIFLIEKGADIHAKNQWGSTPLHSAAYEGLGNLVKLLLDKGADVRIQNIRKYTPLCRAMHPNADPQTVRLLLERGSDVNVIDNYGGTPISFYTTWEKPLESFFLLLLYGADVNKEPECTREKINSTPELENCLEAFEEIKEMPNLDQLIEVNKRRDKKESATAISEYINNEAKGQELIAEFKTIKEKCDLNTQLSFIPKNLFSVIGDAIENYKVNNKTLECKKKANELSTKLEEIVHVHGSPKRSLDEVAVEQGTSKDIEPLSENQRMSM